LSGLKLPDTTITLAQTVAAGGLGAVMGGGGGTAAKAFANLPEFCRVTADIAPTTDSHIKIEVWMPVQGWNGKYQGRGNGGFAGYINFAGLADSLGRGFATASTDTGHTAGGTDASWALGHPEKMADFGYRGIHLMTVEAKAIITAFYGGGVRRSYFSSCSNGGRQALMEAERFPEDYDGIIAGAPANYWTHLLATAVWNMQATQSDPASYIPAAKIHAIGAAVVAACDAKDHVSDGIINDPPRCNFDPAQLLCKEKESDGCLTGPQLTALRKIYSGPRDSKGNPIFPGLSVGGEEGPGGWQPWVTGPTPGKSLEFSYGNGFFSDMVFGDPAWDFRTFDFDTGVKALDEKYASTFNAASGNLKAFETHGGKLIIYHGWSDAAIPPQNSVNYFNSVVAAEGSDKAKNFVRLYMVPGMQHCSGGPGANSFGQEGSNPVAADPEHSVQMALEQWVEKHDGPHQIIATKFKNEMDPAQGVKMTRPLCPFPQVSKYKGAGDTNDAGSFTCAEPEKATKK
jgi:feruloyl esterase